MLLPRRCRSSSHGSSEPFEVGEEAVGHGQGLVGRGEHLGVPDADGVADLGVRHEQGQAVEIAQAAAHVDVEEGCAAGAVGAATGLLAIQAEPDGRRKLPLYAALARSLLERMGGLLGVLVGGAAAGEPDLVELAATTDQERLIGTTVVVQHLAEAGCLRAGLDVEKGATRCGC